MKNHSFNGWIFFKKQENSILDNSFKFRTRTSHPASAPTALVGRTMVELKSVRFSTKKDKRKLNSHQGERVFRQRLPGKVEINLKHCKMIHLEEIAYGLKDAKITTLRLFCSDPDCEIIRFSFKDPATSHILTRFFRELAHALGIGGWLKHLEIGFKPWKRDLRTLSEAIGCSGTLQKLSLANSTLGDAGLQLLARELCNCPTLQILDLSRCALTDSSHVSLASILKASVGFNAEAEWQSSLRGAESKTKVPSQALHRGLYALDLSFNFLSDTSAKHICKALCMGAPLAALNLQGNQMQRKTMKRFLSIFEMGGILRIVDLRDNLDRSCVGVLENGEHLSFFSVQHEPFWTTDGTQTLRDVSSTSSVFKKESSPRFRKECVQVCEGVAICDVLASSKRSQSTTSEMKQIPSRVAGVISLSPLLDIDTESASIIQMTILPTSASYCEEELKVPYALRSTSNCSGLNLASPLPPHHYLSTPSDYSGFSPLCEDHPDLMSLFPMDLTCDWNCCCTSVSTNDGQTNPNFSPGSLSHKSNQQGTHAAEYKQPIDHHTSLDCRLSPHGREYPTDREGSETQTSAASTRYSEATQDDSEWDAFMDDMAQKLLQVQDGLDLTINSGKPDFLITAQTTMITLQEGIQQLLALET